MYFLLCKLPACNANSQRGPSWDASSLGGAATPLPATSLHTCPSLPASLQGDPSRRRAPRAELLPEVTQRIAGLLDDPARRAGRRGKPSRHRCSLLLLAQAAAAHCRRRQPQEPCTKDTQACPCATALLQARPYQTAPSILK